MKNTLLILFTLLSIYEISAQKEIIGIWKIGTSSSTVVIALQKEIFIGRIFEVTKNNRLKEVQQLTLTNTSSRRMCKIAHRRWDLQSQLILLSGFLIRNTYN